MANGDKGEGDPKNVIFVATLFLSGPLEKSSVILEYTEACLTPCRTFVMDLAEGSYFQIKISFLIGISL